MRLLITLWMGLALSLSSAVHAKVPEVGYEYTFTTRLGCTTTSVMSFALAGATHEQEFRTRVALAKQLKICFQEEPLTKGLVVSRTPICVVEFRNFSMAAWVLEVRFSAHYTVALLWLEPLEEV